MDYAAWHSVVTDDNGKVVPQATITVRHTDTGALARLYNARDGSEPKSNPFQTGADGMISFFAAGGAYTVIATSGTMERRWSFVPIGTAQEYDIDSLAEYLNSGVIYHQTYADMAASQPLQFPAASVVLADPDGSKNGYYTNDGSGWLFARTMPDSIARATIYNNTDVNSPKANISQGINPSSPIVFFLDVADPNTGSVTLTIDGIGTGTVLNAAGNVLSAGEWLGRVMLTREQDGRFRIVNDPASAIAAALSATQAGEARDDAVTAKDLAEIFADDASESADNAAVSEGNAASSAANAAGSATAAENSATAAAGSASTASTKASEASSSASDAALSASTASTKADEAASSATAAASSATTATNQANRAEDEADRAEAAAGGLINAVQFVPQTLTPAQQEQARNNIGSATIAQGDKADSAVSFESQYLTAKEQAQARENIGMKYAPRDVLNPYPFGAVGDGVADDGPALRAMFALGGAMYIPKGIYRVQDGYIQLFSNTDVTLHPEAVIVNDITDPAWQKSCLFINGPQGGTADNGVYDNTSNIHFRGGTIDGSGRKDRGLMCALFNIAHHKNISFRDMKIINPSGNTHAVELNSTRHGLMQNVTFDGYALNGATAGNREYVNVDYSFSTGFPEFGPYDNTVCDDIIFDRCVFLNGDVAVGSHSTPPTPHTNIRVIDCVVDGMISAGIDTRFWDLLTSRIDRTTISGTPANAEYILSSSGNAGCAQIDGRYFCVIPDDRAVSIPMGSPFESLDPQGIFTIGGHSGTSQSPIGLYWANASPGFLNMTAVATRAASNAVDTLTGVLSGTTGVDGRTSISAAEDGKIYIENRRGSVLRVDVRFMRG